MTIWIAIGATFLCAYLEASLLPANSIIALVILFLAAAVVFFVFRYFSLKQALREMHRDLSEIRQDLSRNQILHLPLPDRDLEQMLLSVNSLLEEVRLERQSYEKREAEFQKLIENISHDLRTPLTVILGYLKWMQKGNHTFGTVFPDAQGQNSAADPPCIPEQKSPAASLAASEQNFPAGSKDIKDILAILERNARTMEKLVSQFYDFSRLNARDYSLKLSEVDVCRILKESIVNHYQLLEEAGLNPDSCLPDHPVMIRGNVNALERIFSNLFQNAGRYAQSFLNIRLEEIAGGQVNILFQNDSEPVTEDDLSHFFNRFYKNDSSRSRHGSGLGLTVARSLTELMGGTLIAALSESRPGSSETEKELVVICFTLTLKEDKCSLK